MAVAPVPLAARGSRLLGRHRLAGRLLRSPSGALGLALVTALVLVAALAPVLAPHDDAAQEISRRLEGPSAQHLMGTDHLGRDLLSRVILGTRIALGVSVPAVTAALVVGLLLGLAAGYLGGRVDNVTIVAMDAIQAFPPIILALTLLVLVGPSLANLVVVIAIAFSPQYYRVARASVLALKQQPFVEAERSLGARPARVLGVHLLPNVVPPLFILLAMNIPSAITVEAGLSFLGVGVQPPTPSWGVILAEGFDRVRESPWAVVWPGLALVVATLGFTMLGESLRDLVDPRLIGLRRGPRLGWPRVLRRQSDEAT